MQANSQVKVSITASLASGFNQAFTSADKQMSALGKTAADLSKKVGDIQAFRRQQNALKDAAKAYTEARNKAAALRTEIAASENPTRKQQAALDRAERAATRAGAAYSEARAKLSGMNAEMQRAGVNTSKLSGEYRRLQGELTKTRASHDKMEASLLRQQRIVNGMASAWGKIQSVALGVTAAGAVLSRPAGKAINYDEQLARLADTATAGGTAAQFQASKSALSKAVQDALKSAGGGTREEVLSGLSTLIATGNMSTQEASALLPLIARGSFGSGASGQDIAGLVLKMQKFGVSPERGLDIAMRGGQVGGVELQDMARFLPEQLASGRSAGYSGDKGLASIVAMNQIALGTAGNPDQAANNVTNLLNKLSSRELSKNVSKETGVNFDDYALKNMEKGIYKAESFAMLADKQMQADPKYRALKKRADAAKGAERAAVINDMASMMEGSGMGALIQDRQALAAALAMMFARRKDASGASELSTINDKILNGAGGVGNSAARLSGETFASVQRAKEGVNAANESVFNSLSGPVGKVVDGFTNMAREFPGFTSAVYAATVALTALAAANIFSNLPGVIKGRGGAAVGGSAGGKLLSKLPVGGAAGTALRMGGGMAGIAGLAGFTTSEEDDELQNGPTRLAALQAKYGQQTIDAARKKYQPWYQVGRGYAAENEQWVGKYMADQRAARGGTMTAGGGTSEAALNAAKAASEAAKAAQSRPNVTVNQNVSVSVTAQAPAGSLELTNQIEKAVRGAIRKADSDARASMFGNPAY